MADDPLVVAARRLDPRRAGDEQIVEVVRRPPGPPFTSSRSSGANTVTRRQPEQVAGAGERVTVAAGSGCGRRRGARPRRTAARSSASTVDPQHRLRRRRPHERRIGDPAERPAEGRPAHGLEQARLALAVVADHDRDALGRSSSATLVAAEVGELQAQSRCTTGTVASPSGDAHRHQQVEELGRSLPRRTAGFSGSIVSIVTSGDAAASTPSSRNRALNATVTSVPSYFASTGSNDCPTSCAVADSSRPSDVHREPDRRGVAVRAPDEADPLDRARRARRARP